MSAEQIIQRAEYIVSKSSIKTFDGLHLASTEAGADILLTTDMKFLKAANKLDIKVKIINPIDFLMEVMENEYDTTFNKK